MTTVESAVDPGAVCRTHSAAEPGLKTGPDRKSGSAVSSERFAEIGAAATAAVLICCAVAPPAASNSAASVQFVPRAQLAGIPVGDTIGISGAPEDVPTASSMLAGTWAICSRQNGGAVLDLDPAGHTSPGPSDERVFVTETDPANPAEQSEYLVWDSVKYPLSQPSVLSALGLGDQQPGPVAAAWLNALPTGPAVVAPAIPHAGERGPKIDGATADVGTLFTTGVDAGEEDYILLSDGLAPITRTETALFEAGEGAQPHQISTAAISAVPISANRALLGALPDFLSGPVYSSSTAALCVRQSAPGSTSSSSVVTESAASVTADPAVVLPAASGMLVEPPGQSPDAATTIIYLVTDNGERYLIDSSNALDALSYASAPKVVMPASVIGLIPEGPDLDVNAAAQAAA